MTNEVQKKPGIKLAQKGLGLVIVPFIFNSFWLVILFQTMNQVTEQIALERDQSMFIERLNPVIDNSFETRENYLGYIISKKVSYLDRGDLYLQRTKDALLELSKLPHLTQEQKTCASQLTEVLEGQLSQLSKLAKGPGKDQPLEMLSDIESSRRDTLDVLANNLGMENQLLKQRKDLDSMHAEAEKNRGLVQTTVLLGIVGNLLLTTALILFLNKDMSKRLSVLMENAQRLSSRESLNKPIGGSDELTYLDQTLHKAAGDLSNAFEFRSSVMQMVAHDMRSPLFACKIALEYIFDFDQGGLSEKALRQLRSMQSNMDRMVNLINDLLLIEQFEDNKLQVELAPENIKELAAQAILSLGALAEQKNVSLKNEATVNYVEVDRGRILQVLVNYLSNAIKFSPKNSIITITTARTNGLLKVAVNDKGVGLKPEDAQRLFQKFFQAKDGKAAGGSGLGLAISKLIIGAHGGEVGVFSKPNEGSSFWFSLPCADEQVS